MKKNLVEAAAVGAATVPTVAARPRDDLFYVYPRQRLEYDVPPLRTTGIMVRQELAPRRARADEIRARCLFSVLPG